ncbi:CHAT domain-containing protein [Corynebacterium meridianum]|uniref:CHAT domain-containing protein n=1 Tax=Corynebacterium meridianum TaxID=2765363 RepID=A0A934I590_9CORY|nr:CHAT domain-containing protein [Corynebacterium meridianum]MBI8988614.1 CHAT domain-containing protein [Corynebacterium meridianum]
MNTPTQQTPSAPDSNGEPTISVLVRMADAGDTYLSWIVMEPPYTQHAQIIDSDSISSTVNELDNWLTAIQHADAYNDWLDNGLFTSLERESRFSEKLGEALLPEELWLKLLEWYHQKRKVQLRITPSPRLARVPWELLWRRNHNGSAERRLIELATIINDPPSVVHVDRPCRPKTWTEIRDCPALHIIDPRLPNTSGLDQALGTQTIYQRAFNNFLSSDDLATLKKRIPKTPVLSSRFTRRDLSQILCDSDHPISRLFYFGHVSSSLNEPGSASLHLSDEEWNDDNNPTMSQTWGYTSPIGHRINGNRHLPFSAMDLLSGTLDCQDEKARVLYGVGQAAGHELWPMPPRVALIACEGGIDFRSTETFGLVIVMLRNGADTVTTTRWPLPTDYLLHTLDATLPKDTLPTSALAFAVDKAHRSDDPIRTLRGWQLEELARWRETSALENSPVLWASLSTIIAPWRDDIENSPDVQE